MTTLGKQEGINRIFSKADLCWKSEKTSHWMADVLEQAAFGGDGEFLKSTPGNHLLKEGACVVCIAPASICWVVMWDLLKSLAALYFYDLSHITDPGTVFHLMFQELAQTCQMPYV